MKKKVNTLVALAICAGLAAPTVMQASENNDDFVHIYKFYHANSDNFSRDLDDRLEITNKCVEQYTLYVCVLSADCSLYKKGDYYKKKQADGTSGD